MKNKGVGVAQGRLEVALLGNGATLPPAEELALLPMPTIGLNRSWMRILSPYHMSVDRVHIAELHNHHYPGMYFCSWRQPNVDVWLGNRPTGWYREPRDNSRRVSGWAGTVAIELAYWLGYRKIYLVAYDLKGPKFYDPDGKYDDRRFLIQRSRISRMAQHPPKDTKIVNCSPNSALKCFPVEPLPIRR
jgi:hypothetical protein